jgi:mannitol-specific phosphotransferase system IIBC component
MVWEAKEQTRLEKEQKRLEKKRQKMTKEERKKDEEREKRSTARREREERKRQEEFQKKQDATMAAAQMVADILIKKLSNDEIDRICEVLEDWRVTRKVLAIFKAPAQARQSHSDNVTEFPPKPWESKS